MKTEAPANIFDLQDDTAYQNWRAEKLENYPAGVSDLIVSVKDAENLTSDELASIQSSCRKTNMVVVQLQQPAGDPRDKLKIKRLGQQLGLIHLDNNLCADEDSITSLTVVESGQQKTYIPYSNKPISWHTDGYYNKPNNKIRALMLHCVSPAAKGGENAILDHEIAYIQLRDANRDYIAALMQKDAMTIPANDADGTIIREAQSGPVFSVNSQDGKLHMRYTHRTRSIIWKDDNITHEAVAYLKDFLESDSPFIFRHRLQEGQNLIANNILHTRTAFEDDESKGQKRLIYRARYFDRMSNT